MSKLEVPFGGLCESGPCSECKAECPSRDRARLAEALEEYHSRQARKSFEVEMFTGTFPDAVATAIETGRDIIYRCPDGLWAVGDDENIAETYPDAFGYIVGARNCERGENENHNHNQ